MSFSSYQEDDEDGKAGNNGSPGEQTCAKSGCHDTYPLNSGSGSVVISVPGMTNWQYVPGQTYTINVTVSQNNVSLFGFGFEALLQSGANAGILTAGTGSHALSATVLGNSRKTITHLLDGGASPNSHTFSFTWVAPATGVPVSFYAAGNAASNNGTDGGDFIYTTSQALTPVVIPVAPTIANNGDNVLCNGETVTLSVADQAGVTFNWYDESDVLVGTGISLNVSDAGCYDVIASSPGGNANSTNVVCLTSGIADATFSGLADNYCSDEAPVALVPVSPGGIFSGNGVTGNQFDPAAAGVGSHLISYSVTNGSGCTDVFSVEVIVDESPDASFVVDADIICSSQTQIPLLANSEGGVFSGVGVDGNFFSPVEGAGMYTITYQVGTSGCANTSSVSIDVLQAPDASFAGLDAEYCNDESATQLLPSTAGGTFTGAGIQGDNFNPAAAGPGIHEIQYTLNDNFGCIASDVQQVIVNQSVSANFSGLENTYCDNAASVQLIADEPGGQFSSNASDGVFNPAVGAGSYEVSYSVGEGSCNVTVTQLVEVLPADDASFTGLADGYCINAAPAELITANPGILSGPGISGNIFNPSEALIGENFISHIVTASNGCVSEFIQNVFVYESANSAFSGPANSYCLNNEPVELLPENPGGIFQGSGIEGNLFYPEVAGPGVHVISYLLDFEGCNSVTLDTVEVNDLPVLTVTGLQPQYCLDDASAILLASQGTAEFFGPGISDNVFSPLEAGPGAHEVSCVFTDENGCESTWVDSAQVFSLPSDVITMLDFTLVAQQDSATYQWVVCPDYAEVSGQTGVSFAPENNGEYACIITQNGCDVVSSCIEVLVDNVEETYSNEGTGMLVYPNPAADVINVQLDEVLPVRIYNNSGQLVLESVQPMSMHIIQLGNMESGLYRIIAGEGLKSAQKTFIIEK